MTLVLTQRESLWTKWKRMRKKDEIYRQSIASNSVQNTMMNDKLSDRMMLQQMLQKQDNLQMTMLGIQTQMLELQNNLAFQNSSVKALQQDMQQVQVKMHIVESEKKQIRQKFPLHVPMQNNNELAEQINRLERKSREKNLRLVGFKERPDEDCYNIVRNILREDLDVDVIPENVHRIGRRNLDRDACCQIVFQVSTVYDKDLILKE